MKCNNFFCERHRDDGHVNCDLNLIRFVTACPQRKAFNRFKRISKDYASNWPLTVDQHLRVIKKELSNP